MAPAYKAVPAVTVHAWGKKVGAVARDPRLRAYSFEYAPEWIASGIELAPLQMPLRAAPYTFPNLPEPTYRGLPALLADALPDEFGNALIDSYLASKGVGKDQITSLDRLAYMASRAMGALEFRPSRSPRVATPTAIELHDLVTAARSALSGNLGGDREAQAALKSLLQVGTSAGGQRAKAVIAWNPITEEICSGQVPAPEGFDHWLLKLDGVRPSAKGAAEEPLADGQGYGRIEFAYYRMAIAAGIEMSECRLFEEGPRAHFMTRRFDRDRSARHHVQSLCAMDHIDYKQVATHDYAQLFSVIDRLQLGERAMTEAFRRMTFNVAARNQDDHTKNVAFLMRQGEPWTLAPAFDVTYAHNPRSRWVYQHLMAVNGKFKDITVKDLMAAGDRWGVAGMRTIIEEVNDAVARWPEFARYAGVGPGVIAQIGECLIRLE